jgi:hypothetical protein
MGHEVTVCPDGLTAVAALERNTYDCILVDLDMPGPGRHRSYRPRQEALARHRGRGAHRQVVVGDGRRRAASRSLRLPHQALQTGRPGAALGSRRGQAGADQQVPGAETAAPAAGGPLRPDRRLAAHAGRPRADRQGRPHAFDRDDLRRDRHRQGAGRTRGPRSQPAGGDALGGHQLRRLAGKSHRERALRPPQGLLHRRRRASRGPVRGGQRRHALLGRDRRAAQARYRPSCCGSSKAARSAAWARTTPSPATSAWSAPPIATWSRWSRAATSARTSGSASTPSRSACHPCASGPRTFRSSSGTWPPATAPTCRRRSTCSRPRPWPSWRGTPGRGTSASWPT